tara:strand:- start:51 stop:389 length:339 start_codon:yes stop_codon:yes gene_type:complete
MNIIEQLKDRIQGKAPKGAKRSVLWRKVRKRHLKDNPTCAVCESKRRLQVHHKIPFHIAPHLELEPTNLVSLCENGKYGIVCHIAIGHLGNYRRTNPSCDLDIMIWNKKLRS